MARELFQSKRIGQLTLLKTIVGTNIKGEILDIIVPLQKLMGNQVAIYLDVWIFFFMKINFLSSFIMNRRKSLENRYVHW